VAPSQPPGRVQNLLPPAIGQGQIDDHALVVRQHRDGLGQDLLRRLGQILQLTGGTQAHSALVQLVTLHEQGLLQEHPEGADLGAWSIEILLAESVEGQDIETELATDTHAASNGMAPGPVSGDPGQVAALRPATVAIHDDRDVTRQTTLRAYLLDQLLVAEAGMSI